MGVIFAQRPRTRSQRYLRPSPKAVPASMPKKPSESSRMSSIITEPQSASSKMKVGQKTSDFGRDRCSMVRSRFLCCQPGCRKLDSRAEDSHKGAQTFLSSPLYAYFSSFDEVYFEADQVETRRNARNDWLRARKAFGLPPDISTQFIDNPEEAQRVNQPSCPSLPYSLCLHRDENYVSVY